MTYPDTFNSKLRVSSSQLAIQWIKDVAKSSEEKSWAKTQLLNLASNLDEYFTQQLQTQEITLDTPLADFKTALEALLPDAFIAFTTGSTYTPPAPDIVLPYLTRLGFLNRFTNAELGALYTAAAANVQIKIYIDKVLAASFIDPARLDTRAGVQYLETVGLLAAGRALEILDAEIQAIERYTPGA